MWWRHAKIVAGRGPVLLVKLITALANDYFDSRPTSRQRGRGIHVIVGAVPAEVGIANINLEVEVTAIRRPTSWRNIACHHNRFPDRNLSTHGDREAGRGIVKHLLF